ncbi:MAG: hypothetical protein RLZ81_1247, partial [Pseudomonadota bacterium]
TEPVLRRLAEAVRARRERGAA